MLAEHKLLLGRHPQRPRITRDLVLDSHPPRLPATHDRAGSGGKCELTLASLLPMIAPRRVE